MLYIKVGGLAVVYFDSVIKNCINEDAIDIVLLDEFSTVMDSNKKSGSTTVSSKCRCNSWFIRPGGGGDTHGREFDRVVSLYVEEGGYSTRI